MSRYTGYVTHVTDGDTFKTRNHTIRIAGINAPEAHTWSGKASTSYLKSLIEYKDIIYEQHGTSYGRIVATVWRKSDGLNIGDEMVRAGHARRA